MSWIPGGPLRDPVWPQGACYDEPVEKLRWWKDTGRGQATVTAMRNSDIECFWREAQQDIKTKVGELVNASARKANKQVALGSSVKKSLEDVEPPSFGAHSSLYKEEHCSKHERVGRRGVTYSPEAMQAFLDSKDQALRNKTLGRGTNLTLAQF